MIKNIVFDLGNVLLRFNPQEYVQGKIADSEKARQVYQAIFQSKEWPMLDRGVITEEEAIERIVARHADIGDLIRWCMLDWFKILTPIEDSVAVLRQLKDRGYKTYVLSNYHKKAYAYATGTHGFFDCFDGGVVSYQVQLLKPEPEIYETLIRQFRLNPAETLFIDDTPVNVEGGIRAGLATIWLDDPTHLKEKLAEQGIL